MATKKNNTQNTVRVESATGGTTILVDPIRARNLVANGWHVVGEQTTEQSAPAPTISVAGNVSPQPESVGNKGLFLALIALAMRADEGIQGHEVAKALGLSPTTVNIQLRRMVESHYLERVANPADARKCIHYLTAIPRNWNPEEAESILADYKARAEKKIEEESGAIAEMEAVKKMRTRLPEPSECAMAKALGKNVVLSNQNISAYEEMLDFIIKAPVECSTGELKDIIYELIRFLQMRIASVMYDCPLCGAIGSVEHVHGGAHCVKCDKGISLGTFEESYNALKILARMKREE